MRTPVNTRYFGVSVAVSLVHLVSGLIIATGVPQALHITVMAIFGWLIGWNIYIAGVVLVGSALFALIPFVDYLKTIPFIRNMAVVHSLRQPDRLTVIVTAIPQQSLGLLHIVSILLAFGTGYYPDGYIPGGGQYFIIVDQLLGLTLIFWYLLEYTIVLAEASRD